MTQISLRSALSRTKKQRKLPTWTFFGVLGACTLAVFLLPSRYESHLKFVVKNERVDPVIGADKQTQSILYANEVSESRVNTEIQLMTSGDVLRKVVETCHLADIAGPRGQLLARRQQAAFSKLTRDLTVAVVRGSNVIEAKYDSTDAHRSAEVLRALSQAYLEVHRRVHGVPGSLPFFEQLSANSTAQLQAAETELAAFRIAHHIVELPEQKTLALNNIAHLQSEVEESTAGARRSEDTAALLKGAVDHLPASVERGRRSVPNQAAADQLASVLIGLQNRRAEAGLRYQPGDRTLRELDVKIEQTQAALTLARQTAAVEVSTAANPTLDFASSEFLRASAENAGALAKTRSLQRVIAADRRQLTAMDAQTAAYRDLERRVAELVEQDDAYRKRAQEARQAELLDEQNISNLALIEQPYEAALPTSPKRGLLLALGFLWALAMAIAVVIVREVWTERVDSPFDVERTTGLPLLATLSANLAPLSYGKAFPALYLSMQRSTTSPYKRIA